MTVKELIEALQQQPPDCEVVCWLPGSTIRLGPVMKSRPYGTVLIEGNVNPGSALERD